MKKKILTLFMAVTIVCSVVACGSKPVSTKQGDTKDKVEDETEQSVELDVDEKGYVHLTKEQLVSYVERVELTKDNWNLYFEDYCDVEDGGYNIGFGLKKDFTASCHNVEFKFTGETQYNYSSENDIPIREFDYKQNISRMNYQSDGSFDEMEEDLKKDYCVVELGSSPDGKVPSRHFTKFECIDVTGELYIYYFPEEVKTFTVEDYYQGDIFGDTLDAPLGNDIAEFYEEYHK